MARLASVVFTASVLASAAASFADIKTYAATGSANFSDGAAWSPVGAPAATDSIVLGNAITADSTLTIDSGGVVAGTTVDTTHAYTIALGAGGPTAFNAGALNINAGSLVMAAGGSNTLRASALTIASGATLNLHNNSAIFDFGFVSPSNMGTIRDAILAGQIVGDVTGTSRIGFADASTVFHGASSGTFAGQSVSASTNPVLMRHTLAGDANLDGKVGFDDLVPLAMNWNTPPGGPKVWISGDFNYDSFVNFPDLVLLAQNYGDSYVPSALELTNLGGAGFAADWALAQSLVPEPTSIAMIALGAGLLRRRRS